MNECTVAQFLLRHGVEQKKLPRGKLIYADLCPPVKQHKIISITEVILQSNFYL